MSTKQKYQVFFIGTALFLLSSCGKKSTCFKGSGDIVQEHRIITKDVLNIVTEDNIDIIITQSNDPIMIIEGGENLLPYINTDVSGNVLSISSDNKCSMFRDNTIPITVYLSVPNLTRIDYAGQGNITSTNKLKFPFFVFDSRGGSGSIDLAMTVDNMSVVQHSGPADFHFSGSVNDLYVYTLGSGWFHLEDFLVKDAHVNHSGIGDVFVNVKDELSVEMRSRGSVYYMGNPTVVVSPNIGEGSVVRK